MAGFEVELEVQPQFGALFFISAMIIRSTILPTLSNGATKTVALNLTQF